MIILPNWQNFAKSGHTSIAFNIVDVKMVVFNRNRHAFDTGRGGQDRGHADVGSRSRLRTWSSLDKEKPLAFHITSPFNKNIDGFVMLAF